MKRIILIIQALIFITALFAQNSEKQSCTIMCYNVENYFDCLDDSLTDDSEFLPTGIRGWNYTKYKKKQTNIGRVITAIGGWDAPVLVGLCEIENDKCLYDLTRYSGLKNLGYKYLHHESPDARGVDVALLYQPTQFKPFHNQAIKINFPNAPDSKTRDILFASGTVFSLDTLHVFVCHFPSRLGGELESEEKRWYVASVVRAKIDSLFASNAKSNIIVMGDFNDFPTNKSIAEVLGAKAITDSITPNCMYNLMYQKHLAGKGSNKHAGEWGALDQILVSGNLLNLGAGFYTSEQDAQFFDAGFLLENDKTYLGKQPFRTYLGMKYQDGYSDHLPVFTRFYYNTK